MDDKEKGLMDMDNGVVIVGMGEAGVGGGRREHKGVKWEWEIIQLKNKN